ncbi:hypothetical protein D3C87_1359810 [compost metagenome]
MMAQARQAPDVLMEVPPQKIRNDVAQHPGDETQQERLTERQRATACQYRHGEQQHRAGNDQPGNRQAFHKGHDEYRCCQPLRVDRQPSGHAIEPLAHKNHSIKCSIFYL